MKNTKQICHKSQQITIKATFYLIYFIMLFSTGCNRYQYISIDSHFYKNENNEFVAEDDTIMMKYTFKGSDFPITLTVFNKLQQPIYFDRQKSMVIMNGDQITDAYDRDDQVYSIAPQSSATVKSNKLSDKFIPLSPQDKTTKAVIATTTGSTHVKLHVFDEENSPVYFTSVLAFSTHHDLSATMFYDQPFWVSSIYQTMDVTPLNTPANQFYFQKSTGFSTFMGYTGAFALFIALLAISPQTE